MKMDFFRSFRSYIFDFGGGLVWMTALFVWLATFISPPAVEEIVNYLLLVESSRSLKVFLIACGVILPFVVNIALKPFSLFVMNTMMVVQRLVLVSARRLAGVGSVNKFARVFSVYTDVLKARIAEAKLIALQKKAHSQLVEHLGIAESSNSEDGTSFNNRFSQETMLLFVKKENSALADSLDRGKEDVWFRSSLVVPTALIAAAVVQFAFQSSGWSIVAGLVSFIIAFVSAARAWRAWHEQLNAAVLILFRR